MRVVAWGTSAWIALSIAPESALISALLLREPGDEKDDFLTAPVGIEYSGGDKVECTDDVDPSKKEIFATVFGCGDQAPSETDSVALCQPFMKGGCDNEVCHKFCHGMYMSHNEYASCKCKHWGADQAEFKTYSPGAPCPLKVQPRCYQGKLYRSQCEAQHANPGVSIDEFVSVKDSEWTEGDMSAYVINPVCTK